MHDFKQSIVRGIVKVVGEIDFIDASWWFGGYVLNWSNIEV